MKNTFLKSAGLGLLMLGALASPLTMASYKVLDWASKEGQTRLMNSVDNQDFFSLAPHFEGQSNKVFCGIASMAMVANALSVTPNGDSIELDPSRMTEAELEYFPKDGWSPFFHRYTQESVSNVSPKPRIEMFGKPTEKHPKGDYGMQLTDFEALGIQMGFKTVIEPIDLDKKDSCVYASYIKKQLIAGLADPDNFVVVNYSRAPLEQRGAGHYSPIGAYHPTSDSFLVMDVSNTYQTWVWISSHNLLEAMATVDGDQVRGYAIVSKG
ncbi:phytochelatin synthase [Shewanella sp. WXL01]|uniref:phytochelatin synthase family protein n=1 Tax=Shewanella sp. WXL01 TaxID=2709721 RepID=UPI0014382A7D|nr:phytochelatin synthase family protein [Shewanella sp. WXL01]NKF51946.1 phytochelatin synthase [Shewanella sp. WXL01]